MFTLYHSHWYESVTATNQLQLTLSVTNQLGSRAASKLTFDQIDSRKFAGYQIINRLVFKIKDDD